METGSPQIKFTGFGAPERHHPRREPERHEESDERQEAVDIIVHLLEREAHLLGSSDPEEARERRNEAETVRLAVLPTAQPEVRREAASLIAGWLQSIHGRKVPATVRRALELLNKELSLLSSP